MPMPMPPAPDVAWASELMPPDRMQMIENEMAKFEKRLSAPLQFLGIAHAVEDFYVLVLVGIAYSPGVDMCRVPLPLKFSLSNREARPMAVASALCLSIRSGRTKSPPSGPPISAARLVCDLVVADFDHRAGQPARARMPFQRVVDAVGRRIGLVDADRHVHRARSACDQRRGQPAVVVMDDADLPGPAHAACRPA